MRFLRCAVIQTRNIRPCILAAYEQSIQRRDRRDRGLEARWRCNFYDTNLYSRFLVARLVLSMASCISGRSLRSQNT